MSEWEAFVHDEAAMPPLVRSALMHQHFETIHPFRDGNGTHRAAADPSTPEERHVLRSPLLYLSAYFEAHRQAYYDHLSRVSETGEWDPWLDFFLSGVVEQSHDAMQRTRALRTLQEEYRQRLLAASASANALQMADELFLSPDRDLPPGRGVPGSHGPRRAYRGQQASGSWHPSRQVHVRNSSPQGSCLTYCSSRPVTPPAA